MKLKEKSSAPPTALLDKLLGGEKKEPEKAKKKMAKHKRTVIESHRDAEGESKGYTVRHSPDSPEEVSYTASDLNGVKDGLEEHLGGESSPTAAELLAPGGKK